MPGTDENGGQAAAGTQQNADGNASSSSQTQDGQFTQAQLEAKMAEAAAKAVNDFKAGNGRNEKEIREAVAAEMKADLEKKELEAQGKFEDLNKTISAEKQAIASQLEAANKELEESRAFKKALAEKASTENASILGELEKNVSDDKKDQFEKLKSTLPTDPFLQKEQLVALKSIFGEVSQKKNSPKTPIGTGSSDVELSAALEEAKKRAAEKQSSYGKWRK